MTPAGPFWLSGALGPRHEPQRVCFVAFAATWTTVSLQLRARRVSWAGPSGLNCDQETRPECPLPCFVTSVSASEFCASLSV